VDEFFEWLKTTLDGCVLLPSNPFTEAASYALAREGPLRVFLEYPDVPIDTNHLEREIRPIALPLSLLGAAELEGARKLLESYELAGWILRTEAAEWAARVQAWRQFHELDVEASRPE